MDCLHLDIWQVYYFLVVEKRFRFRDHDDETNVLEAVKKLNEVKGVRGIRRFFKQVAQSAKGTDQDDFLGCVTIPIQVTFPGLCIGVTVPFLGCPKHWF